MTASSKSEIPQHIAVIMDGNNRWAKSRQLPAKAGHRHGTEAARKIVYSCISRDIKYLTLFAFSSENWLRPRQEVQGLMALFLSVLKRKEINQLYKRNVRLQFIGNRSSFSEKLQENMREVEELTRNNTGTTVVVAADYGGRWDIVNSVYQIVDKVASGELDKDAIDADLVHTYTAISEYPDPDLCIRTGGEHRISNFLLWQFAYTELYFTDCYWPDFDDAQFQLALDDFAKRQRRYGSHDDQDYTDA
ncbi:MAG: polyprenyl diphosphate synthase [Gammaproteobacteria bacterium]|nr:polyprenyl diphosphate synthase [Gammaproteobacteria bacterium]MDG2338550.1 polyprenyl diphosphate synthase [Gammaproteobacteria bacterium]